MMLIKKSFIVLLVFDICSGISFNQPKFDSCASWDTNAITLWNETHIGQQPTGIFINIHDKIYLTDRQNNRILIWHNESFIFNGSISQNLINPWSIFVTDNHEIIIDNGYTNGRVDKWTFNQTKSEPIMFVSSSCADLFVDIMNSLYCSSPDENRVFKLELNKNKTIPMSLAGTGCPGPVNNMLDQPHGIFVDETLNLFVADTNNNRIQCFKSGQVHAITVAGFGATIHFLLNKPTDITLDADGNLFIVDSGNHRIIRSIQTTFECIFGCSANSGSSSSQLNYPQRMAFDKNGNIFVTDVNNHRIQKFILTRNSCVTSIRAPTTTTVARTTRKITAVRSTTTTNTVVQTTTTTTAALTISGCFYGKDTVHLADGGYRQIENLKVGDRIWSLNHLGTHRIEDEIIMMIDNGPNKPTLFYTFKTKEGYEVSLTGTHNILVYLSHEDRINYLRASKVTLEHQLIIFNKKVKIENIIENIRYGYYAPLTLTSYLLVNNISTSVFPDSFQLSPKHLHHIFIPIREYYHLMRWIYGKTYDPFGSNYTDGLHPLPAWMKYHQNKIRTIYLYIIYIFPVLFLCMLCGVYKYVKFL